MGKNYDLIVLGTGSAGFQVAMRAKEAGKNVAAVEKGDFGGVCSSKGCIPKKVLAGTAELVSEMKRMQKAGIVKQAPEVDWQKLIEFKRSFTSGVSEGSEMGLRDAGVDVYKGNPSFTGKNSIKVGEHELTGETVHIAVGAEPAKIPIEGYELMLTSDQFLEMDSLPESMIFIGGGYISFEFAHIAATFGSSVTILEGADKPLPLFDADMVDTLVEASTEVGIAVHCKTFVASIEQIGDSYKVTTKDGQEFTAAAVVHGAGRTPAIHDLNLEAAGIDYDAGGVLVDDYLKSVSNPHVYAAGDAANSGPQLSPVAGTQGTIAAQNILGAEIAQPDYVSTPSVLFASPQVAGVGMSALEAAKDPKAYDIKMSDTSGWFMALRRHQKFSKSKVILEKDSVRIVGAHLIGDDAGVLINIFALAIEHGFTAEDMRKPVMAFPTSSDDMRWML